MSIQAVRGRIAEAITVIRRRGFDPDNGLQECIAAVTEEVKRSSGLWLQLDEIASKAARTAKHCTAFRADVSSKLSDVGDQVLELALDVRSILNRAESDLKVLQEFCDHQYCEGSKICMLCGAGTL